MIEQIHGAGLSGTAGKTGKSAKNGLFGKLLMMLEQHTKLTGKGKGLQLAKGGKQSVLSGKENPLLDAKSKQLMALAMKGKHHDKPKVDDKAIPLLAAHVFMDTAIQSKKAGKGVGKAVAILQTAAAKSGQPEFTGKQSMQVSISDMAGGIDSKVIAKGGADKTLLDKTAQSVLTDAELSAVASAKSLESIERIGASAKREGDMAVPLQVVQKTMHQKQELSSAMMAQSGVVGKTMTGNEKGIVHPSLPDTVVSEEHVVKTVEISKQLSADKTSAEMLPAGRRVEISKQLSADKVKTGASTESSKTFAAVHLHQNKTLQLQHGQVSTTTLAATTGVAISESDASLTDSGSQSSGKGSQDGRYISALNSDVKSGGSASTAPTQFNHYLNGKAVPSMSVFDSISHIAHSASKGKTKLEIQLDPAHLGKIQISLQSDASKQLQVHIIVDQGTTRAALEQQLPQLK
ncbi:MAG: flagellar hook-length control protein FliK, partial [Mariprofundus sp.]|nr:flagellar hook-length control protein FliK [Mariprofundus sp.]